MNASQRVILELKNFQKIHLNSKILPLLFICISLVLCSLNICTSNKMAHYGDINDPLNTVLRRLRRHQSEIHDLLCEYKQLDNWVIAGTKFYIYILVRVCGCKQQSDKSHMLERTRIEFEELGDGVEMHLDRQCRFTLIRSPTEGNKLEKVCSCPKHDINVNYGNTSY